MLPTKPRSVPRDPGGHSDAQGNRWALKDHMTNSAQFHGGGSEGFITTTAPTSLTLAWGTILSIACLSIIILIIVCFSSGYKNRHDQTKASLCSTLCMKLGILSLILGVFVTISGFCFDLVCFTNCQPSDARIDLLALNFQEDLRATLLSLLPCGLGICASVILDMIRFKQLGKKLES